MKDDSGEFVGYCNELSVAAGDPLQVHVATATSGQDCWVDIYRVRGCADAQDLPDLEFIERAGPVQVLAYPPSAAGTRLGPGDADVAGCGWPESTVQASIPSTWTSGVYLAQFTSASDPTNRPSSRYGQDALFIVRPAAGKPSSKILVQLGVATWNAYHIWQNRNLYIGDIGDPTGTHSGGLRAHKVSFHRPAVGLSPRQKVSTFPPTAYMYTLPFIQWLNEENLTVDYCAGTDIDRGLVDLADYRLLVTIGHDEYWSKRQRDAVEGFVSRGGNAAFLGGNLAYWQVRLAEEGRVVECYKRAMGHEWSAGWAPPPLDPLYRDPHAYPGHDNSEVTVEYHSPPLHRSPVTLTGASMRNDEGAPAGEDEGVYCGAGWWWENFGGPPRPAKGFTVLSAEHWVFDGTGLSSGDVFGEDKKIVGFEADGIDVEFSAGVPRPTFRDGAPNNVEIIAFADCSDWSEIDYSKKPPVFEPGRRANDATLGAVVTMISWSSGQGRVVTAPVTDWPRALVDLVDYTDIYSGSRRVVPACPEARMITKNILVRLGELEG
ncbi:MAG: hypothetical protein JST08_20490 [Actinobacteria bacterium]|nr:hypothetical protein [Actinomycetota bacterium]